MFGYFGGWRCVSVSVWGGHRHGSRFDWLFEAMAFSDQLFGDSTDITKKVEIVPQNIL